MNKDEVVGDEHELEPATVRRHPEAVKNAPAPEDRAALFEEAREHTPFLGVETGSGTFLVATSDGGVGRSLFVKGGRPEFRTLKRAVMVVETLAGKRAIEGRTFFEVGANIGTTTVAALVSQPFGSALACEPEQENFSLLRANLALNNLDPRARAVRAAASNRAGKAKLVVVEDRREQSWIAIDDEKIEAAEALRARRLAEDPTALTEPRPRAPAEVSEMTVVEVELVTVDGLVDAEEIEPDDVGMLWIDAEGHEGHILEGAGSLTERGVPTVLEFHPSGLDERGAGDKVNVVAAECYTHFVDIRRRAADRSDPRFQLQGVGALPEYANRFRDSAGRGRFTDLLLLRLDDSQVAAGEKLPELLGQRRRGDATAET